MPSPKNRPNKTESIEDIRQFPFNRGSMPMDAYFMRLLAALTIAAGGELRIKVSDILTISPSDALMRTVDSQRGEIVLRFGSRHSEMYFVPNADQSDLHSAFAENADLAREISEEWSPKREVYQVPGRDVLDPRQIPTNPNPQAPIPQTSAELTSWLNDSQPDPMADQMPPMQRHLVLDNMRQFLIENSQKERKLREQNREGIVQRNKTGNLPFRTVTKTRPPSPR